MKILLQKKLIIYQIWLQNKIFRKMLMVVFNFHFIILFLYLIAINFLQYHNEVDFYHFNKNLN